MIGRMAGTLLEKSPPWIVVDVGGIGYELEVPMSTFCDLPGLGEPVRLRTHLVVREDGHFLYGFATEPERATFRQLLRISGIGARIALAVLSGMSVAELSQAVVRQESARLLRVPGIGKRTAERLLLELRDKLPPATAIAGGTPSPAPATDDVLNALSALGYTEREALAAIAELPPGLAVAEGIRQALRRLART